METLTDTQKKIADALIDWALEHKDGVPADLVIEESKLAELIGATSWKREHAEDLSILCAYCARMDYPMVPLLVVIPGFGKPEKSIFIHAFKQTLPTAEAYKRWNKELADIEKTKPATWDAFKANVHPEAR